MAEEMKSFDLSHGTEGTDPEILGLSGRNSQRLRRSTSSGGRQFPLDLAACRKMDGELSVQA
ncbi:MAG: hypothetical protein ACI361_02620 [Atopobiaceae bacterium]